MEREDLICDLCGQLETLARFHIQHQLGHTEGVARHRESISAFIREHEIDIQNELDPIARYYYRRFVD